MFLYQLTCSRCKRVKEYKTGIAIENFTPDTCICGGKHSVVTLSDNADNEVEDMLSYEAELNVKDALIMRGIYVEA